jgi:hypothetical protein
VETLQLVYTAAAIVSTVVSGVACALAWHARQAVRGARIADAAAKVTPLERELGGLRDRVRDLEQRISAQPTVAMVHDIQLAIAELKGQMLAIGGEVKSANASAEAARAATDRIEQFFLKKAIEA